MGDIFGLLVPLLPRARVDLVGGKTFAKSVKHEIGGNRVGIYLAPLTAPAGLIGLSVFDGYRVTLDLHADRLVLDAPGDTAVGEPYWTLGGQMLVRAQVAGESGLFLFDTGSSGTLIHSGLARRLSGARLGQPTALRGFGGTIEGAHRYSEPSRAQDVLPGETTPDEQEVGEGRKS